MRANSNIVLGVIALAIVVVGAGIILDETNKGPFEEAGEEIDEALDSVGDEIN